MTVFIAHEMSKDENMIPDTLDINNTINILDSILMNNSHLNPNWNWSAHNVVFLIHQNNQRWSNYNCFVNISYVCASWLYVISMKFLWSVDYATCFDRQLMETTLTRSAPSPVTWASVVASSRAWSWRWRCRGPLWSAEITCTISESTTDSKRGTRTCRFILAPLSGTVMRVVLNMF